MIDLHCHILPALDDGARDLGDSIEMARQAAAHGIEIVAATPHIRPTYPDVVIDELEERVAQLNTELARREVAVRVVTGGEVAEPMLDRLDEEAMRKVSLGGQGWILLEPRPGPLSDHLEQGVEELTRRGFRSLVAHPERHVSEDFRERLEALVAAGALIQVTASKIADGPATPVMLELAELGLVHVVATDAHSSRGGRPLRLLDGLARLREIPRVAPYADWTVRDGPAAILAGEDVMPPFAPVPERD
ncbi:MAG: tyrosine-protein phosphatase [Solirubrobacterales bacterium]